MSGVSEGEGTSHDHDFGSRWWQFEEDSSEGRGGGGVCSGVCLHQNHERDIFHCPNRAPSHFLPPQTAANRQSQANKYLRKTGKVFFYVQTSDSMCFITLPLKFSLEVRAGKKILRVWVI